MAASNGSFVVNDAASEASFMSPWIPASLLLIGFYYLWDLLITFRMTNKYVEHPLVGRPLVLIPRTVLNFFFASDGTRLLKEGYQKYKNGIFRYIRNDGNVIVLPQTMLEELSALPPDVASPHGALEHDLLGPYTALDVILESRMHHTIVQRKLTPRLGLLTPALEKETSLSFDEYFPDCSDWQQIRPYKLLAQVAARLSARAIVGTEFCRNEKWLEISVEYTENLFKTIVIMRFFPEWMHPLLSRVLPSCYHSRSYIRMAKDTLGPKFAELLAKGDQGFELTEKDDDKSVLTWLAETAKRGDRNPETLAHVEVLLALASVHTTLLRMVNVLYDLVDNPSDLEQVRGEIQTVASRGWSTSSYNELRKLDSVLRESQRMSPPTILGMKRLFRQPYTMSTGLHIPKDTYVCLPTYEIENDPGVTVEPRKFDGLRSYRLRQRSEDKDSYQFSTPEPTVLNFGYGKSACPGRHFASLAIKMVMVRLLMSYDFSFLPGSGRPKNYVVHEFLFPWPWSKILAKKREKNDVPF